MRQGILLVWFRVRNALPIFALALAASQFGLAVSDVNAVQQPAAAAVARGLRIDATPEQIQRNLQLLGSPPSLPPGASLHLVSVRKGFTPGTWLLRLDCSSRRDCLPFHAVLSAAAGGAASQANEWTSAVQALAPGSRRQPGPSAVLLAHSGERVSLVEELAGMRLQVKVVCLQSGGLGDRIRVQNPATHRVLLATVAGKDLVRVE